jgi:hypothetical protein
VDRDLGRWRERHLRHVRPSGGHVDPSAFQLLGAGDGQESSLEGRPRRRAQVEPMVREQAGDGVAVGKFIAL